ncbi:MAG: transferrin-binding protein-like solute binding protein [Rhizobiaceae bacterium]|nr:transferrin-binding protein-like solute binding protein [Rhizobiaceae bacterium]
MRIDNRLSTATAAGALTIMLAGCGPTVTFDTAGKMLSDNKTLTASTELTANVRKTTTAAKTSTDFTVKRNGSGGVDVNVAGKAMSFSGSDVSGNVWTKGGNPLQTAGATNESTTSAISASDSNYAQVWQYLYAETNELNEGFAVVGNPTPVASLPGSGSVNYSGRAGVIVTQANAPATRFIGQYGTTDAKQVNASSAATLTANFGSKTVTGALTGGVGVQTTANGQQTVGATFNAGSMTLGTANISGASGQYTGAVSGSFGAGTVDGGSTYTGQFFGPNAEETAGVINFGLNNGGFVGVGAFHADKQ